MKSLLDKRLPKRKFTLYNGRAHGKYMRGYHAYIAAYSNADAARIMMEAFNMRSATREINVYWSKGSWGNPMEGVTPERGCWVCKEPNGKPERIL